MRLQRWFGPLCLAAAIAAWPLCGDAGAQTDAVADGPADIPGIESAVAGEADTAAAIDPEAPAEQGALDPAWQRVEPLADDMLEPVDQVTATTTQPADEVPQTQPAPEEQDEQAPTVSQQQRVFVGSEIQAGAGGGPIILATSSGGGGGATSSLVVGGAGTGAASGGGSSGGSGAAAPATATGSGGGGRVISGGGGNSNIIGGGGGGGGKVISGGGSGGGNIISGGGDNSNVISGGGGGSSGGSAGGTDSSGSGSTPPTGGGTGGASSDASGGGGTGAGSTDASGGGSSGGASGGGAPTGDPRTSSRQVVDRLVSWVTVGGSGTDPAKGLISDGTRLKEEGWTGYVRRVIVPQIQWGCRRFVIHNPFGCTSGQVFQLDQLLEARARGMGWLEDDFVAAWKPITEGRYGQVEIIAYFGTPVADRDFERLRLAGRIDEWMQRARESLKPALDAGMDIGLDMVTGADANHPAYRLAQELTAGGTKVYIEGVAAKGLTHWWAYDYIMMSSAYERTDADLPWLLPVDRIPSDVVQWMERPPNVSNEWVFDSTVKALRETRHSVAANVGLLGLMNRSLDELRRAAGESIPAAP